MKRVLIVDDEEDMVWTLKRNLRNEKLYIDIFTARSGEEALAILKQEPLDLIITDIKMPGISGLELLVNVKNFSPQTGVIIMTAYPTPEFKKEALFKGCLHFIEKPFDIAQLRSIVKEALNEDKGFKGTVAGIELTDIIQIYCISKTTAALRVKALDREGLLFFKDGKIVHAICENFEGEEAFCQILSFEGGTLESIRGAETPVTSITSGYESLLMEGLRRLDESRRDQSLIADGRSHDISGGTAAETDQEIVFAIDEPVKSTNDQEIRKEEKMENLKNTLREFTGIDGVTAACLAGRDGFIIDSLAPSGVDVEMMAAIASTGLGASESMGRQLAKGELNMTMVEYTGGSILLTPIGQDAFLVIIAEEKANLGMIRFATRKHRDKLSLVAIH